MQLAGMTFSELTSRLVAAASGPDRVELYLVWATLVFAAAFTWWHAAKGDGELKPEYRLLPLMYSSWLVPIGLFIYGWTAQYKEQWAIPLFGTLLFGVGIISALICVQVRIIKPRWFSLS